MADRRRRRRVNSDEESEELSSQSEPEAEISKELNTTATSNEESPTKGVEKTVAESEYESAEEEDEEDPGKNANKIKVNEEEVESPTELIDEADKIKVNEEEVESPTELIDEEGGEEGIADAEIVEGEFLDGDVLGVSDEEEEYVEEERQQGDGEECTPNAVQEVDLDFDEDRRNPQYIPKKGTFYEHDDRNNEDLEKEKESDPTRDKKKKKLWLDEGKWGHDRYREEEQTPKSKNELIEAYGYDIRGEDGPPRARRRRRYGRGPTKYDRNWEDETAYEKERTFGAPRGAPGQGGRGRGRFPGGNRFRGTGGRRTNNRSESSKGSVEELNTINNNNIDSTNSINGDHEVITDQLKSNEVFEEEIAPIINKTDFPALPTKPEPSSREQSPEKNTVFIRKITPPSVKLEVEDNSVRSQTFENSNFSNRPPVYEEPPRRGKNPAIRGSYRSAFKRSPREVRGRRGQSRGNYVHRGDGDTRHNIAPRLMDKQVHALDNEMERLSIVERNDTYNTQNFNDTVPESGKQLLNNRNSSNKQSNGSVAPSRNEGDSSSRPKRYSSLRQRSLPETANYPPTQASVPPPHPTYYDPSYQAAMYPEAVAPSAQPQTSVSPPIINPPQYPPQFGPAPYQDSYTLRMPVNSPPRLFPQVALSTGQPMLAPPPCITPNPNLMNFAPPPPPPAAYPQFTYQQYPAPPPPPPPVTQPPDLFRGGITYYYTQGQPPPVRTVPLKRPKAAIPIVPPPENEINKKDLTRLDGQNSNIYNSLSNVDDVDSTNIRTDSSTVQIQAPVEVES